MQIKGILVCPIPNCESFSIIETNELKNNSFEIIKEKIYKFLKPDTIFDEQRIENLNTNLLNEIGICLDNNHEFCLKCKHLNHNGKTCDLGIDMEFNKFIHNSKFIKRCPQCNFYIQKNQGCNHITCANSDCKYEFCWICMKKYSQNHYRNPLSTCTYLQNTNQDSFFVRHPWLVYIIIIFYIIYCIFIFSLLIIISPLISSGCLAYGIYSLSELDNRFQQSKILSIILKITYYMTYIILGLGLYPVIFYIISFYAFFGTFFGTFILLWMICKYFQGQGFNYH